MSDKPFQIKCLDMFSTAGVPQTGYIIGGPKLPLAQMRKWEGSHMKMLERVKTTPKEIIFKYTIIDQIIAIKIDRITGKISRGEWSEVDNNMINLSLIHI